jgi:hypothetical protein
MVFATKSGRALASPGAKLRFTYRVPVPAGGPREMSLEDRCNVAPVTRQEFELYAAAMRHGERFALTGKAVQR